MTPHNTDDADLQERAQPPWARLGLKRAALNRWENEGGLVSGRHKANPGVRRSPAVPSIAAVVAMRAQLNADVASGLVGQRHNTFGHRTRVLAQLTRASIRVDAPSSTCPAEQQQ